ncbi:unnamed protein product [Euphydryas editha]|uniref:CCHC-type domain-containing protein n=1 Tax=Euphydryas editha TaxID=104508 RepID=A0AAU9TP57_EUPED|nr:unnamed protein product [Euphydryas editha]
MLKDRIVTGIIDKRLKDRLLRESDLTLSKEIQICKAAELAEDQIKKIANEPGTSVVQSIKKKNGKGTESEREIRNSTDKRRLARTDRYSRHRPEQRNTEDRYPEENKKQEGQRAQKKFDCSRCGFYHSERRCPAYGKKCKKCGKMNHYVRKCRARDAVKAVQESESSGNESCHMYLINISNINVERNWYEYVYFTELNRNLKFKLDSGAQCNVLSANDCYKFGISKFDKTNCKLTSYSNEKIETLGKIKLSVKINDQIQKIEFQVCKVRFKNKKLDMDLHPTCVINKFARKKTKDPTKWKTNIAKCLRYSSKSMPTRVCEHNTKALKCATLTMNDLSKIHQNFYKNPTKHDQDIILFKLCSIQKTKETPNFKGKKKFKTNYSVFINKKRVPICQKFFLNIFGIKKYRVEYLMKKFYETGEFPREARGGDRKTEKYAQKKESVHRFIQSLRCIESHYCRKSKEAERKYLPCELNIKKLYTMYNSDQRNVQLGVKLSYFRHIFNTEYNLGFGTPQTDVCSKCLELKEKIKMEKDEDKKNKFMTEKRVHSLRAKSFFDNLRDNMPGLKIISFDFQKNIPLPKVPDQSCYYSRQLYFYNLAVVEGHSNMPLIKERVFSYYCTEDEFSKNANLVASAVYDRLCKTNKIGISRIRLVADGCGGQNKNSILIGMCCKWLLDNGNIKSLEVIFPVTGHSFMPADRFFGVVEKKLRKMEKKPGNVLVRGEIFYKSDLATAQNICKPRKVINMVNPIILPSIVAVNKSKLGDVNKLLSKHFGTEWQCLSELSFYKEVLLKQEALQETPSEDIIYCDEETQEPTELRI